MRGRKALSACLIALLVSGILLPQSLEAKTPEVFRHFGNDIKDTFIEWPAALLLGGAIIAGGVSLEDQEIQDPFRSGPHLGGVDTFGKYAGEFYAIDSAALLTYGAAKLAGCEKVALTGEALVEALVLTEASTAALKLAFRRERPDGGNYSFPSGHASRTFAVASVLEGLHGPALGVPAYLFAALISATRLDMNVHSLSDLLFGAALGSAFGFGTAYFHKHDKGIVRIVPIVGETMGIAAVIPF
jgi:membrane-associated phospholipid phosphatase